MPVKAKRGDADRDGEQGKQVLRPGLRHQFTTISDLEVPPLIGPDHLKNFNPQKKLGKPGEYPYTRGIYETMYRGKPWTMRLFAGFGTAKHTNERFHMLLDHGQTGLSTAFHMPTLRGFEKQ